MKTSVVGTQSERLVEALLLSTHSICFREEIRKLLNVDGYPFLCGPMSSQSYHFVKRKANHLFLEKKYRAENCTIMTTAPDKVLFLTKNYTDFAHFSQKIFIVGAH